MNNQYSIIAHLHHLQHTVAHALGFSVFTSRLLATAPNTQTIRVLLNHTHHMLLHYSTHKVCTSHFQSSQDDCSQLATHELPAAVSHRELTDNYSRTSFSLSYKPLIWHAGNASIVASLLKRVTSLPMWSRDLSPHLRHPSVYSCCLATNEESRCDAMRDSSGLG
jgi:hypothetical protein